MLKIGLTGGIGSGKSAASRRFEELGVPVIDTDRLSRELVQPGQPALAAIRAAFGDHMLTETGELDRPALRQLIFSDPAAKARLEAILHPRIRAEVQARIRQLDTPYCIVVIPLLVESGDYDWLDRVLVVDVPPAVQVERAMARDGQDEAGVRRIIATQATRQQRLARADDIIDNSGTPAQLEARVRELHERYLRLAAGEDSTQRRGGAEAREE